MLLHATDVRGPKGKIDIFFSFLHGLELRSSQNNLLCSVYNVQITSGNLWNTCWCFSHLGQHLMLSHVIHSLSCSPVCSRNSANALCMECSTSVTTVLFSLLQLDFNKGKWRKFLGHQVQPPGITGNHFVQTLM